MGQVTELFIRIQKGCSLGLCPLFLWKCLLGCGQGPGESVEKALFGAGEGPSTAASGLGWGAWGWLKRSRESISAHRKVDRS